MTLHAQWQSDWTCPYPFRTLRMESEHDPELGQWSVQFARLGIAVELTWVYDADTPLRAKLAGMMADESWLDTARISMPHAEYKALREKAAIGTAYLRWYGSAKGYRDVIADAAHDAIMRDAKKPDETDGAGA